MSGEANSYQGGESGSYQGGGQLQYGNHQPDAQEATRYAQQHYGDDDGDDKSNLFNSVLSQVTDNSQHHLNETEAEHAAHAHDRIYNQNQPVEGQSSRDLGSAAAMQAFKMFSGGGGGSSSGGGGGGSSQLVGMAMGEAMKLFNKQGGSQSGANQSEMLQSAAMMAMKLFMAQKGSEGGSGGGGLGAIMGMLGGAGGQGKQSSGGAMSLLSKFL